MIFTYGYTCALFLLLKEVKVIYTNCGYEVMFSTITNHTYAELLITACLFRIYL